MDYSTMPLRQLALEIYKDWKNVYFGAKPYLTAMATLDSIDQMYYCDTGKSIVSYFLCNANNWKGETARNIKKELKKRLK